MVQYLRILKSNTYMKLATVKATKNFIEIYAIFQSKEKVSEKNTTVQLNELECRTVSLKNVLSDVLLNTVLQVVHTVPINNREIENKRTHNVLF